MWRPGRKLIETRLMGIRLLVLGALVLLASPARAELVFFTSGRSMNVANHRLDGAAVVLLLRGGGEVTCEPGVIAEFRADEAPWPEPPAAALLAVAAESQVEPMTGPYAQLIEQLSAEQGVDARLVKAVVQVESNFQERARSPKGARGLMQLMPATARQYAVGDPYDPRANLEAGIKHLKMLLDQFRLDLALAAYNAGEAAVRRFGGIPPYPETREYVSRILGLIGPRAL
jgi:hypothetical protein